MKLNKLFVAGILASTTLTACSPDKNNSGILETSGDGIIGGWEAQPTDKFQSSIVAVYDGTEGQLCTGSLLPNNLVLTAAHCVGSNPENMYIFFDTKVTNKSQFRAVDKAEVSPYWASQQNEAKNTSDIALLHFQGTIPAGFQPATLLAPQDRKFLTKGATVVLAGFGISNGTTGDGAGTLRVTKVTINNPNFSASELTLDQTQGTGACHGDSGGPAYLEIKGKYYLWGITSRGVQDDNNDCSKYSAYTSIIFHKAWLSKAANKLSRSLVSSSLVK